MTADLRHRVAERLRADGLDEKTVAGVVLSALDGRDALEACLNNGESHGGMAPAETSGKPPEAYLTSITVEGFRGIGNKQTLSVLPGPGLTLVVGRNGSGKSSFAEALEVLFTSDSKRWSDRAKVWKDGWRNLHHAHPTSVSAELLLQGMGTAIVTAQWEDGADVDDATTVVQPKGQKKLTLKDLGWDQALVSYRPFLSYNELGSMLEVGPSFLHDELSRILGLDDLVAAQGALSKARTERQKAETEAKQRRDEFLRSLQAMQEYGDERITEAIAALQKPDWGLDSLEDLLSGASTQRTDGLLNALQQATSLEVPIADQGPALAAILRQAEAALAAVAGTDAERSRKLAGLLESALVFHESHSGTDCPVCGTQGALGPAWTEYARTEVASLTAKAEESARVHRAAEAARNQAVIALCATRPAYLQQLANANIEGADAVLSAWSAWNEGSSVASLGALADHIDRHHESLKTAVNAFKTNAARELATRQDRWRPIATALAEWTPPAKKAMREREVLPFIDEAEKWFKKASTEIRNEAFAPIADNAMAIWKLLRQSSNVELGQVQLVGAGNARRVSLDVTVDGVEGAALSVMSQGELHSLALSLFLPRATLDESPFRFIVIDDPVQSMDPARVDGLARVLEKVAMTRQVLVLTHDDRLPEAVRRLGIRATMFRVTRRLKSAVEITPAMDPVKAHIEDALALAYTAHLPPDVLKRVVPGFCRSALEAAFMQVVRRRRLAAGQSHDEVERALEKAGKLNTLAALALFDDMDRGGDVLKRLNQFGSWAGDAFVQANAGAHGQATGDVQRLIKDTEHLCDEILKLR